MYGLTQAELAEHAKIHLSSIKKIETNRSVNLSAEELLGLKKVLHVDEKADAKIIPFEPRI